MSLLNFIGSIEAPRGFETIYGNNQGKLAKPLTQMTLDEVVLLQPTWTKKYGSSACGRYQFMRDTIDKPGTLADLKGELRLTGAEKFDATLQNQLGLSLLKRRGYDAFMSGAMSINEFAKRLAQEWASFPVLTATQGAHRALKRGQSYYAGDGVNKALVSPDAIEKQLSAMRGNGPVKAAIVSTTTAAKQTSTVTKVVGIGSIVGGAGAAVAGSTTDAQTTLDQLAPVTSIVANIGTYGVYVAGAVVGLVVVAFALTALYKYAKS